MVRGRTDCELSIVVYGASLANIWQGMFENSIRAGILSRLISVKGGLFGPYTPLQQLDVLADSGTKSYIVGSTNSLLLQQRDRYSDILVNVRRTPFPYWS